ncbi:hypothetical protein RND81_10G222700 [Saponaria officinalis]|uniref:Uncharacterized protein n=1 Tax=Saponaria officinalis TaxID=3572 RepID=A0AAW1I7G9_SAPOF
MRNIVIISGLFWVTLLTSYVVQGGHPLTKKAACVFPALYNFGDSNSDTGGISAVFKPIEWPYGRTFFKKPVGRDSDGRLIVDFIAEKIALPYLSAYLNSLGVNFSHGANFATGGSTIRRENETIFQYGISPFSLDVQIWHFDQLKSRSKDLYVHAKNPFARSVLPRQEDFSKALYTFDIGQNDLSVAFRTLNDDQIRAAIPNIISQFSSAVQHLYEEGARSFWIHNTGPIGCLPVQTFYNLNPPPGVLDQYGCLNAQNAKAIEFNKQLKDAVTKLRTKLPQAAITYVDLYSAKYGLISKTKSLGWADPKVVCCGYHEKYDHIWCGSKGVISNGTSVYGGVCAHPERHLSWDGVHYTEAANHWFANQILNGALSDPPVPITHACYRA